MEMLHKYKRLILASIFITGLLILFYCIAQKDIAVNFSAIVHEKMHPLAVIILFFLLPVIGFPISPFLVVLGIKFELQYGILILLVGAVFHLAVSFLFTHSFLEPYIVNYIKTKNISPPRIPENKILWYSLLFMAVPGLSYSMKNYLLPLTGISFPQHMVIGCLTQVTLSIPFIMAGHALTDTDHFIPALIVLVLILIFVVSLWYIRKRLGYESAERKKS